MAKNACITPEKATTCLKSSDISIPLGLFVPFYREFEKCLEEQQILTQEDLIFKIVNILKEKDDILSVASDQVKYLLVDEYQDTNDLQYEFTKLLIKKHNRIFCVGDS